MLLLQPRNLSVVLSQCVKPLQPQHSPSASCDPQVRPTPSSQSPGWPSPPAIFSSILCTLSGSPVASAHSPAPEYTRALPRAMSSSSLLTSTTGTTSGSTAAGRGEGGGYCLDRRLKTNLYSLFAASVWSRYFEAPASGRQGEAAAPAVPQGGGHNGGGDGGGGGGTWMSVETEDAMLVVVQVRLALATATPGGGGGMLLVAVAELGTPLGAVLRKTQETASVLENGLQNFKLSE